MGVREGRVKWLNAKPFRVVRQSPGAHECDGAEAANVAIVQGTAVRESQLQRGVGQLTLRQRPIVDQEGSGKSWLNDQRIASRELDDDELGPPPAPRDRRTGKSAGQSPGAGLAQDVRARDVNSGDSGASDRPVEVTGDRLSFRKLGHCAAPRANRYRCGA